MQSLRSRVSSILPGRSKIIARRARRRLEQLTGSLVAHHRLGVVAMLHVGRCGSTVLANMLGQHKSMYWDGKIHRAAQGMYGKDLSGFDYAAWTKRQFLISGRRYYGFEFKILSDQYPAVLGICLRDFLETCKSIGVTHYLILRRKNTLRHVISHYASIARGRWHSESGGVIAAKTFCLDLDHVTTGSSPGRPVVEYLDEVDAAHNEVASVLEGQTVLNIEYESDIDTQGPELAYRKVCEFLSLSVDPVFVNNRKLNPYHMAEIVENFAELEKTLTGTRHEWMLHEEICEIDLPTI